MTAPTVGRLGVCDKYVIGVQKTKKIRGRETITGETWNVRTLRASLET